MPDSRSTVPAPASEPGPAVQAIAAVVDAFGDGFDTEERSAAELRAICGSWVDHLLRDGPSPDTRARRGWRDWPGLRDFVRREREGERDYFTSSVPKMRDLLWTVIHQFGQVVSEDRAQDREILKRLRHLKTVTENASSDELRHQVLLMIRELSGQVGGRGTAREAGLETLAPPLCQAVEGDRPRQPTLVSHPVEEEDLVAQLARAHDLHELLDRSSALVTIEVDRFQGLRESFGASISAQIQAEVADCVVQSFPRKGDRVFPGRAGAFVVLLMAETNDGARKMAEKCSKRLRKLKFNYGKTRVRVSAAFGVAVVANDRSVEVWLGRARKALEVAKKEQQPVVVATT